MTFQWIDETDNLSPLSASVQYTRSIKIFSGCQLGKIVRLKDGLCMGDRITNDGG